MAALQQSQEKFLVQFPGSMAIGIGQRRTMGSLIDPQKSSDGKDIYANMRKVKPGDLVFHFVDNHALTGVSVAASKVDDSFVGLKNTDWADRPGYRIQLEGFTELKPSIERLRERLRCKRFSRVFFWPKSR